MKKENKSFKMLLICIFLIIISINSVYAQVARRDSTVNWFTYDYSLSPDMTLSSYYLDPSKIVEKTFDAIVLENEYLKVTLVPGFGARVLSMIYKPTGHEQLYQNPVGAPYGWWWTGTFYYNWLMIWGGIFPTLTEPEHGKSWLLPWDYEIIKENADTISVKMIWDDNVNFTQYSRYGETDIDCEFIVTLISGKASLDIEVILNNKSNSNQSYEYWTNTGMAPGSSSEPYKSAATEGAEILIPVEKLKIPSWAAIKNLEQRVPAESNTYYFENLKMFKNWDYSGSAFSRPALTKNFWGVINHDNKEGLIRISENVETPYVKIWTFGFPSTQIDPFNPPQAFDNASDTYFGRPFIELWAGVSSEFNVPAVLSGNSVKSWKEVYSPTVGLSNVTHAGEEVVAEFKLGENQNVICNYFSAWPNENINVEVSIKGQNNVMVFDSTLKADPVNGNQIIVGLPGGYNWTETDSLNFSLTGNDSRNYLSGAIPILSGSTTSISKNGNNLPSSYQLFQNYPNPFNPTSKISYSLPSTEMVRLSIFDILGREVEVLVDEEQSEGTYNVHFNGKDLSSGLYIYRIEAGTFRESRKMILMK